MSYVIKLPFATPSQNTWQRWHWGRQAKFKQVCQTIIRARLSELGLFGVTRPGVKVGIVIRRFSKGHLDRGNFIGGCKPVLDALRDEGVIHDDSEVWLEDAYQQHPAKSGEARAEIEVWGPEPKSEVES